MTKNPRIPLILTLLFLAAGSAAAQQTFRVRLLGTAGPSLYPYQAEAGLLVVAGSGPNQELLLFDCGRGVPENLGYIGATFVNKVFLTHLHSDHVEGLPILWMNENTWSSRGNTPLTVWGPGQDVDQPAGAADITSLLAQAFATNTHIRRDLVEHLPGGGIQFQTNVIAGEGVVYQNNGVTVSAFLVDHHPVKPAFGYRVDFQGHSIVFSGDTTASPNLVQHAQGADLLIHEVIVPAPGSDASNNPIVAYHTTPEQAAGIFNQVNPKLAVYTHIVDSAGTGQQALVARTRAAGYSGPLAVGQDLSYFDVGDTVSAQICPTPGLPAIAAITTGDYQSKISAGGTVIVWGANFTHGLDTLYWVPAGGGGSSVVLNDNTGLYYWDQSSNQINATLPSRITPGNWLVYVTNGCQLESSPPFQMTVNLSGSSIWQVNSRCHHH
jgi:ribonuclease Z